MSEGCSVVSDSLWTHRLYSPWNSPGQNTGVGSLSLLQGIFPTQGSNPRLLHCRQILYQLSHKGSPKILEWVVYPFSSGSSQPRNWIGSPALQADSLPTELWGKVYILCNFHEFRVRAASVIPRKTHKRWTLRSEMLQGWGPQATVMTSSSQSSGLTSLLHRRQDPRSMSLGSTASEKDDYRAMQKS